MDLTVLLVLDDDPVLRYRAASLVTQWLPPEATVVALHPGNGPTPAENDGGNGDRWCGQGTDPGSTWPMIAGSTSFGYPYAPGDSLPWGDELEEMGRAAAGRAEVLADGDLLVERQDPGSIVRRVAADLRADLIVVAAAEPWGGAPAGPAGSGLAGALAADAPCPVLVVREADYEL